MEGRARLPPRKPFPLFTMCIVQSTPLGARTSGFSQRLALGSPIHMLSVCRRMYEYDGEDFYAAALIWTKYGASNYSILFHV